MATPEFHEIGPYVDPRYVAEGGMAWVFQVQDPRFATRQLALKVLKPDAAQGEELLLFEREAELLAGISHPNLVTIFDYGRDEATGYFYYTMSFIEGPSLSQLIQQRGQVDIQEAVDLMCGVLDGLEQLHVRGIVHRDIKPGNILVAPGGRPVLMDLGIARVLPESELTQYTRTEVIRGTPLYMSPEQSEGKAAAATSDLFSVGLTLYCMLTGRTVYEDAPDVDSTNPLSVRDYLGHLRYGGGNFGMDFPSETPRAMRDAVKKCCRIRPEERYQSAAEMAVALREALEVSASGNWRWAAVAAVGLVAALGVAGGGYWYFDQSSKRDALAEARTSASRLSESAPTLIERVKDLDPAPAAALIDGVERSFERAQNYLIDAQDDEMLGNDPIASANFQKAAKSYLEGCGRLGEPLSQRADKSVARASERIGALEAAGAPKLLAERWSELEARTAALAPVEGALPSCDLLERQLVRIDESRSLLTDARVVQGELRGSLRERADGSRSEARNAQRLAEIEGSEAPEFSAALAAGAEILLRADGMRAREDFLSAAEEYASATDRFQLARQVVPAWKAREDARSAEQQLVADGKTPASDAAEKIRQADVLYSSAAYEEARELYENSITALTKGLQDAELEDAARTARSSAAFARDIAAEDGAEASATGPLTRGDTSRGQAEVGLQEGRYADAQRGFRDAETSYDEARTAAIEALVSARGQEERARAAVAGTDCGSMGASSAQAECSDAQASLAAGVAALSARDAPKAASDFKAALAAIGRARDLEGRYMATRQQPPRIEERRPERPTVEVRRNRSARFSVAARDPNPEDKLRFSWSFDGRPLDESAQVEATPGTPDAGERRTIELLPQASGRLEVKVSDSRGETVTEVWDVVVDNAAPELALLPAGERVNLEPGAEQAFTATATDADGDPVSTVFRLNGNEVGSGESYLFSSARPGTYRLEVVATDAGGAASTRVREITVKAPRAVPPPPPPEQVAAVTPDPATVAPPAPPPESVRTPNQPPRLSVTPSAGTVGLETGQIQSFRASVSDPDGDAVSIVFKLDGKEVGRGTSYRFEGAKPGQYSLVVAARDAEGNTKRVTRKIEVEAPPAQEGWRVALSRYERALEGKDMQRLQDVWLLPKGSLHRTRWESRFRRPDPLEIKIDVDKVQQKGDKVIVIFDQTESQGQRTRKYRYRAVLLKRASTDDWQIIENGFVKT